MQLRVKVEFKQTQLSPMVVIKPIINLNPCEIELANDKSRKYS